MRKQPNITYALRAGVDLNTVAARKTCECRCETSIHWQRERPANQKSHMHSTKLRTNEEPIPSPFFSRPRFAEPLLLCHSAAPPTQRLVPTRRWRGWDNKRVASGVEMSHICTSKKKHQLVVAQPTITEDDANLFSRMSNRNTTLRPRARGSKVHSPAPGPI